MMSKRYGNSNSFTSTNAKKPKMNDIDDLWGDDLDINDVDDCFMLASQIEQQPNVPCTQLNNVSILPSYEGFKQHVFTSTQKNSNIEITKGYSPLSKNYSFGAKNGTTSTGLKRAQSFDCTNKEDHFELKFRKLEEEYKVKVGEVGILRSNLNELRVHNDVEQKKLQKEWREKLDSKHKQLQSCESLLEFKNLEIINLTQKLKEATKIASVDVENSNSSPFFKRNNIHVQRSSSRATEVKEPTEFKIYKSNVKNYPLKDTIELHVFEVPVLDMCVKDINRRFFCPTIQNYVIKSQLAINIAADCTVDSLYDSMKSLRQCNELYLRESKEDIEKLWTVSKHLIKNLLQFLQELRINTRITDNEYILNLEILFMDESCDSHRRESLQDEMGLYAAQSMVCLSDILPHNHHIADVLFPKEEGATLTYLRQLLLLLRQIRNLKVFSNFKQFFKALIRLLNTLCIYYTIGNLDHSSITYDVMKEIILCAPSGVAVEQFFEYLNSVVLQTNCFTFLCGKSGEKELKIDHKLNTLIYEQNSCILHVLFILLDELLKRNEKFNVCVLKFIVSCFRSNSEWFSHKDNKRCSCISKGVRLFVDLMYKIVEKISVVNFDCNTDQVSRDCELLKWGVDTLIFLNSTLYDVVAKYVVTFSRYKVIIVALLYLQDALKLSDLKVQLLESLGKNEEVQEVDEKNLKNAKFFKEAFLS